MASSRPFPTASRIPAANDDSSGLGVWGRGGTAHSRSATASSLTGLAASSTAAPAEEAAPVLRPPEAEGMSVSMWASRFKRERAPGEGPIGPPADHSGGFGRGRPINSAATAKTPAGSQFGSRGQHAQGAAAHATASGVASNAEDPPDSANSFLAPGNPPLSEGLEDEAKILDALRLEEKEREAARTVEGWSAEEEQWFYKDYQGNVQGPFKATNMQDWYSQSYFKNDLLVRHQDDQEFKELGAVIQDLGESVEPFLVAPLSKRRPATPPPPPQQQQQPDMPQHVEQTPQPHHQQLQQQPSFDGQQQSPWQNQQQQHAPGQGGQLGGFPGQMGPYGAQQQQQQFPGQANGPFGGQPPFGGINGEPSLEEKLRQQEQYILMVQARQILEQQLRAGLPPDQRLLAVLQAGMAQQQQQPLQQQQQAPWSNQAPQPAPWGAPQPAFQQMQQQPLHHQQQGPSWDAMQQQQQRQPGDPWGASQMQQPQQFQQVQPQAAQQPQQQPQESVHAQEHHYQPAAIGTPRRSRSPEIPERQPEQQQAAVEQPAETRAPEPEVVPSPEPAPQAEPVKAAPQEESPEPMQVVSHKKQSKRSAASPQPEEVQETRNNDYAGNLSVLPEDEFHKHDAAGNRQDVFDEPLPEPAPAQTATPTGGLPAKPAPWANATEVQQKQSVTSGPSLREIQEAEQKAAEARKNAERARRQQSGGSAPAAGQPVTLSWGLASMTSAGSKTPDVVSSPTTGGPGMAWNTSAVPKKKTLAEIQEEEQKRLQRAKELAAASRAGTASKAYADSATRQASQPPPGAGWSVIGASGKASSGPVPTAVASRPSTVAAVAAPQRAASGSSLPTKPSVPSSTLRVNGATPASRSGSLSASSGPSPEFIAYVKQQLKGLTIKVDDFIEMLLSFPLDPSPDVVEIIAESVYANSGTLDGRRFAQDFVAKRKMDAQGRSITASTPAPAPERSASDVLKAPPKVSDPFTGFKVVKQKAGKKKTGR